jgi:hypothetical protein
MTDIRKKLWEATWDYDDRALPNACEPRDPPTVGDLHLAIFEIDRLRDRVNELLEANSAFEDRARKAERIEKLLRATWAAILGPFRIWRHKKRGTSYVEIARAHFQLSGVYSPIEGDVLVIYRGPDEQAWARLEHEFEDGRFEEISK